MDSLNLNKHISGQFNAELESIRTQVMTMGGMVEQQLSDAITAMHNQDSDLAKRVIEGDKNVNMMEVAIDEACVRIIAKRQPTASDLRLVMVISKTIAELERIGDVADKICRNLNRLLAADLQQARLWSAAPGITPDGWYISAEIDDLNWRSEAARQPLLTWLNNAQRLISDVSAKPVYISSFFAGNMSPDGYRQLLEQVKATGVNVWVQDGSGVDKLTAEQRERYLQASADCQSSAPASGIVYELFVAGKGKTFTAKPKPDAEIASLLAKRSSCGKDMLYFSLRYLPVAHGILEY